MRISWAALLLFLSTATGAADNFITFVCTGNTGRSPMGEALSKHYISERNLDIVAQSRGVNVDPGEITPEQGTVITLKARGIDVSSHRATQLTGNDISESGLLLTMTGKHRDKILSQYPEAKGKVFTVYEYAKGNSEDLSDPYGMPLSAYKALETQLDELLPLALDKFDKQNRVSKR
ncbi:low molecular weight protein arginine phosphatase [Klebsiella sp. PL-2018]|uniref:low molecular weight protein arginine phosphatase n=2 Tax=Klebsiella/Raoultella group TaxID=2890311 RepID=UPI001C231448|nr:low molecular weight protein arginine phosphatase [Klebsiella sp. PL-2018]QXD01045.1 Low molecular weight protein tyrosine phosphatase [Klebsiella sp. PL-2018]